MVLSQLSKDRMGQGGAGPCHGRMSHVISEVMGFGLAGRLGMFNLLIPTPIIPSTIPSPISEDRLGGPHDLWETDRSASIACTAFLFAAIFLIHIFMVLRLTSAGPAGSYTLTTLARSFVALALWMCTTAYFVIYVSVARYGAHNGEWYTAGAFSCVILIFTILLSMCPPDYEKLINVADDPVLPDRAAAA
ncbi:hypothetical protein QOZ80_7AG0578060 [Eleusine coracana subsp. coracana]|nr:hypothetical protein QOZ80_7AG0578060 [Eleusine coracana subsp. coracana]